MILDRKPNGYSWPFKSHKPVNVMRAIETIEYVEQSGGRLNMLQWQVTPALGGISTSLMEALDRGTVCCLAGWISLSEDFIRNGGTIDIKTGEPVFRGFKGPLAVGAYLGIPIDLAQDLFAADREPEVIRELKHPGTRPYHWRDFYDVHTKEQIKFPAVIAKLKELVI